MTKIKIALSIFIFQLLTNYAFAINKESIPELRIGWYFPAINSRVSRADFQVALDFWFVEFNKSVNIEYIETRLFDQIAEMRTAFDNRELDLIVVSPLLLVKYFDLKTLADGFIGINETGKPYGMAVLVRKGKNIKSVRDFKNKRLVLLERNELAETLIDSMIISQFHQTYQQIFSSIIFQNKQNAIIHKLFFDQADVGVVSLETLDLMSELNPQISEKIDIIKIFPIDSPNYSFFHYQYPSIHREKIITEMLKLNSSIRAIQVFEIFRMSSIAESPVQSLDPIIRLNKHYNLLKQQIKK